MQMNNLRKNDYSRIGITKSDNVNGAGVEERGIPFACVFNGLHVKCLPLKTGHELPRLNCNLTGLRTRRVKGENLFPSCKHF